MGILEEGKFILEFRLTVCKKKQRRGKERSQEKKEIIFLRKGIIINILKMISKSIM
jgi:hypothetical protein